MAKVESPSGLMVATWSIWTATLSDMANSRCRKGVDEMARPAARRKQNHVETQILAGFARMPCQPILRRTGDTAAVDRGKDQVLVGPPGASLDLDKDHRTGPFGDDVDFTHRGFEAAIANGIEFCLEI